LHLQQTPLSVRLMRSDDAVAWDDFVHQSPGATFFHLSGWHRVIERAFGHRTYYLMATRDDAIIGVLPLTHLKSVLFGNSLISTAFCVYGGPIATDAEALEALEGEAVALMERLNVPVLEYRTTVRTHDDWACKDDFYVTFRKPISANADENMKAIPRKQRAMVRKAMHEGLRSEVDSEVDRLHAVYAESVRNLGTPVFSKAYFRLLKQEFGDACDIVTVMHGSAAIASVLNFYFRDEVIPYYGGGTAAARALAGNDFLYWEVMRRASERGFRLFDFGRSKIGTGSFAFKKNWGFEPTPMVYQYKLAPGHQVPNINPLNPKYRLFIAAWRRLPLPVSKLIGPMLARNFG
jgi:FemAB-related protein (PEP-CTERM system-associated)